MDNAIAILACLQAHKILAEIVSTAHGPRTTTYTLKLDPKASVRRVARLDLDLAVALGVPSVRVSIAGTVTIEVPTTAQAVAWRPGRAGLEVVLGAGPCGPLAVDLAQLPHLLVAGSTNAGKSVCLQGILASLALQDPAKVKLALCDQKRVELSTWGDRPHLIAPVAKTIEDTKALLEWLVTEMGKRYELIEAQGLRSIAGMDLPRIVLVIDEMADLMLSYREEIEPPLVKLAQLGRAAGIHLVLATQRSDAKVLTGMLKAQIIARVAFAVPSQVDSRVILDCGGAEKLLGRGDGLYREGGALPVRFQGSMATEVNIAEVIARWPGRVAAQLPEIPRPQIADIGSLWRIRQAQLLEERNV